MKLRHPRTPNTSFAFPRCAAALLTALVINTGAQAQPWQTVFQGPCKVWATTIDPFSTHPQPSLFFGGAPYAGASVQWAGPLGIAGTPPAAVASDTESGYTCNDLAFDPSSAYLYSAGGGSLGWEVHQSADGGNSWANADTGPGTAMGCAADGQGNVYVCGAANGHWIVRQRNSNLVWSTICDWSVSKKSCIPRKVHVTPGYVFVVGETYEDSWVVQRLNLLNNTWDTPYLWKPKAQNAGAWAVTSSGTDVYVLGWSGNVLPVPKQCVLMKSGHLGSDPWTIVKTFAESSNFNMPGDLTFDLKGNLYVVGNSAFYTTAGTWNEAWIVRRYDAASATWQSWLPFGYPANQRSFARQVSVDPAGNVFVTGEACDVPGSVNYRVMVQEWAP